ncbi:hypothetical protein HY797_03645 [Candidatus Falkowbacteria bacterium]|nr:hypothetical protein [Candidatus Falkowbacteria bacterium]
MPDINFLNSKKNGDDQKPKDKGDKKEKLAWSNPEREITDSKKSAFSFLPFINKKEPADKNSSSIIDKNKIKESREEILNLIKRHENSKPPLKEKGKNFLEIFNGKLKKQPAPKEVLIDYHQGFNKEKEYKNQAGRIFNVNLAPQGGQEPLIAEKYKNNWIGKTIESFKNKIIALSAKKNEAIKIVKSPKAEEIKPAAVKRPDFARPVIQKEEKPPEVKNIKAGEEKPVQQNETRQHIIETNLIQGEFVTFFDWRSRITIIITAILMPIFIIGAVYYGLVFYQKSKQAKNLAQAQKFAELEQTISKEEIGLKEILAFQGQLKIVSQIFEKHLYWTNFFKFLEDNTIRDVYFMDFDGDTSGNYVMDSLAVNYSSIAEQVNVFKNNKRVTAVQAEGGEMTKGDDISQPLIKFVLNFSVSKNIFME